MKKTLHKITAALLLLFAAQSGAAQEKIVTVYSLGDDEDLIGLFAGSTANGCSPSGEYVVGYGTDFSQYAFLWSRSTGKFNLITGSFENESYAYDVSDNGIVVGVFATDNDGEVKQGTTPYIIPGYWKDGVWTALELATPMMRGDVNGSAEAISADGRTIVGYVRDIYQQHYYDVESGSMNAVKEVTKLRPAVWIDGKLQPWENLPFGETIGQGMWANYMSDDASVLGGVAEHDTGTRSPAVFVNGELNRIYGKTDIDINVDLYFYAGYVYGISHDGKYATGTWCPQGDDGYTPTVGFIYNVETDTTEEIDGWGACTAILEDGTVFGHTGYLGESLIRTNDFNGTFSDYVKQVTGAEPSTELPTTIISASRDGKMVCGYFVDYTEVGPMMMPSIVVFEDKASGINDVKAAHSIDIKGDVAAAPGAQKMAVYDAAGRLVAEAAAEEIALGGAKGVVVVKAYYGSEGTVTSQFLVK